MPVYQLDDSLWFPDPNYAWNDGILAIGGDLSVNRLILAYRMGIFPWFNEGEPILWWSPNPRYVIFPDKLKVSRSMRKVLRNGIFDITYDTKFRAVITACRDTRRDGQFGTWITGDMLESYCALHEAGLAHSVEVWQEGELVGGLYGVSLGKFFLENLCLPKSVMPLKRASSTWYDNSKREALNSLIVSKVRRISSVLAQKPFPEKISFNGSPLSTLPILYAVHGETC